MGWLPRRLRGRRQDGSMSIFYLSAALAVFVVVGLVADGGGALSATSRADDVAQEAARAGGQQIDGGQAIPGEAVVVDPVAAVQAARGYLADEGVDGEVVVSDDGSTLTVTVRDSYETAFASLVGMERISVTGQGSAQLLDSPEGE